MDSVGTAMGPRPRSRTLILVGVCVFVLSLAVQLPARLAWGWIEDGVPGLTLQGVEGSAWLGSAERAFYGNQDLGKAEWRWRPLALLTGELGANVRLSTSGASAEGHIGRSLSVIEGSGILLRISLAELIGRYPESAVKLPMVIDGEITTTIKQIVVSDDRLEQLTGEAEIAGLKLGSTLIGDLSARAQTVDHELVLEMRSLEGSPVGVEALVILTSQGQYELDLLIDDPATLGSDLEGLYRSFSKPTDAGKWRLTWQGSL